MNDLFSPRLFGAYIINFIAFTHFRGGQFRHSRLKEGNNLEVSNPMYMAQATEEDEDDSRQPLDQPYDFDPEKVSLSWFFHSL